MGRKFEALRRTCPEAKRIVLEDVSSLPRWLLHPKLPKVTFKLPKPSDGSIVRHVGELLGMACFFLTFVVGLLPVRLLNLLPWPPNTWGFALAFGCCLALIYFGLAASRAIIEWFCKAAKELGYVEPRDLR